MKRTRIILIFSIVLLIAFTVTLALINSTKDDNTLVASTFVKNEATYQYDGIPETFKLTGTTSLECPLCREFIFEYQSRNSGYGDRKGVVVASVITTHSAEVVMEGKNISSAILDDIWDMKAQKLLVNLNPTNISIDEEIENVR